MHESVGDPDSKEANLSWMPYKDYKIIYKLDSRLPAMRGGIPLLSIRIHVLVTLL